MKYQIVCTAFKDDGSIDKLGFIQENGNINQAQEIADKEKINLLIRYGHSFFFTNEVGQRVEVLAIEDRYVKTSPDGTKRNNLLNLRKCRIG